MDYFIFIKNQIMELLLLYLFLILIVRILRQILSIIWRLYHMSNESNQVLKSFRRMGSIVQKSPTLRGTLYLGSTIVLLEGAWRLQNPISPYRHDLMPIAACPM